MRVGMHEMHALRVRDFLHDDDSASPQLVLLIVAVSPSDLVGGGMPPLYREKHLEQSVYHSLQNIRRARISCVPRYPFHCHLGTHTMRALRKPSYRQKNAAPEWVRHLALLG